MQGKAAVIQSDIQITDLDSLERALVAARSKFQLTQSWWRGHFDASWKLIPGAFRPPIQFEQTRAATFKSAAFSRLGHRRVPRSDLEWLLLAQHYGLPTRLLDWSTKPLVALFFAVTAEPNSEVRNDADACLWCTQAGRLNQVTAGAKNLITLEPSNPDVLALTDEAFEGMRPRELPPALAISTPEIDERMVVQGSAFSLHGSSTPLEELPGAEQFLLRFVIPAKSKEGMSHRLFELGVRRHDVFPDLQALAHFLKMARFTD